MCCLLNLCNLRNLWISCPPRLALDGGNDFARDNLTAPTTPDPALPVVPSSEDDCQIEIRNHDQELAAVSASSVIAISTLSDFELGKVPRVGVVGLAVETREILRAEPGRRR